MTYDGSSMRMAERRADLRRRMEKKNCVKEAALFGIALIVVLFVGTICVFGTMSEEVYQSILHRHERSK